MMVNIGPEDDSTVLRGANSGEHLEENDDDLSDLSDENLQQFCEDIVLCFMIYGNLDEISARRRLDKSGTCSPENTDTIQKRTLLFHEEPYYWAMSILYGQEYPEWWNVPSLNAPWPPPDDYNDPDWPNNVLHRIQRE